MGTPSNRRNLTVLAYHGSGNFRTILRIFVTLPGEFHFHLISDFGVVKTKQNKMSCLLYLITTEHALVLRFPCLNYHNFTAVENNLENNYE